MAKRTGKEMGLDYQSMGRDGHAAAGLRALMTSVIRDHLTVSRLTLSFSASAAGPGGPAPPGKAGQGPTGSRGPMRADASGSPLRVGAICHGA